ncbi:hypothetical protein THAOC_22318 [Thalassiosira oceanica]|uniref:Uncharacterized protein n=1 Tax=Thalassiosira oceanica TaxID=159749 RepID=K0RUV2_THAOC|nr:hypothetical protein THAOC_22318 [Thalassiosira oceanica]|eukprot:EJK57618.1 hypothetical protein THAOC_22318 [Thalassiosira oceanica]
MCNKCVVSIQTKSLHEIYNLEASERSTLPQSVPCWWQARTCTLHLDQAMKPIRRDEFTQQKSSCAPYFESNGLYIGCKLVYLSWIWGRLGSTYLPTFLPTYTYR